MPLPQGYSWSNTATRMQQNGYVAPSREELDSNRQEDEQSKQALEQWDWQNEDNIGPNGEALPRGALGWQPNGEADYGQGLSGWWNKASNKVMDAWQTGYTEGLKLTETGKAAVEAKAAREGKDEAQAVQNVLEERKPDDQNQAYWAAAAEATKEIFNQALWGTLEGLSKPAQWGEQALGSVAYAIADTVQGKDINWQRNWEASRMLYSGLFDASVFAEMERRIDSGMRGDFAAQEVMMEKKWTMWPELVGQVIFDPLNSLSKIGKLNQQIKMQKNAAKMFHEVQNPAIAKLLDAAGSIDEASAYRNIDELVKTQQGLVAAAEHAEDIAKAGKDLDALSNSYKLASLTSDGKVAHLANQTGEIFMHVVNNSSSDEALEILRGMVKSVSKDPAEAAEGISAMMHFADAPALFSEAGNKTTLMMSRMFEKHGDTWLKTLSELKNDPVELTKNLLGKLEEASNDVFPSVSKMLEAEELVKKGGQVSEKVKALADRASKLPSYVKSATKFHDAAQKIIAPINKAFVGAYMGWNPGFAFRNFSNNSVQLLIDYGPGVLLGKADDLFAKTEKLHGGVIQGAFSEGAEAAALFPEASKANARETGLGAIVSAVKEKGLSGPVLAASQVAEANAAKRIMAKTYRQTFDRGISAMIKSVTPQLQAAGFSDDIIKKLPTYILNNDGNPSKVIDALRADIKSGTIDLFNDISRIDPKHKKFLEDVGKWDEYTDNVLKAATREEAEAAAKKLFDDIAQAGDYVYREGRPVVDNYDKFLKMAEKSGMPETRGQLVSLRKTESRKAIQIAENILSEADNLGSTMGLRVGDMKKARGITGLNTWGNDAAKEADRLSDLAWKLTNDSKKAGTNLQQLWMGYPELFPGTPPQALDGQSFRDALWHAYDQTVSKTWGGARDAAMDNVTKYLDDLKAQGAQVPDEWYSAIKEVQEGAQQYDNAMVGRFGELVEEAPMAYGTRSTQIRTIANKSGIASTAKEVDAAGMVQHGADLDKKLLAKINKYADVNYKSLEDVPLHVAEEAFGGISQTADEAAQVADEAAHFDDAGKLVEPKRGGKRILPPPADGELPPVSRAIHEQMEDVGKMRQAMMDDIAKNYGKKQIVNKVAETALQTAEKELAQKLAETKLISSRVAQANRDFTLLNYGDKSYWDVGLAYLYPFHYWYKGTYGNWLKRLGANPSILGHYARYKEILGTVHADMPEWWRYNINTNDLPGVDVENPLYFNLEATLWPLNGLTNTDFNDPSKRVNWWTYSLDFANKFGPSTWSPINIVTGLALYQQGEKEAGERWMGRIFPQSNVIKAAGSILGQTNLETDPFVNFLQGGLDPYERRRVGRALAEMEQQALRGELPYSQEQIQDAAYSQDGEIWEEAVRRAVNTRAPSQISSFLFGVGFKGRTNEDMQVDQFYTDYNRMFQMKAHLSTEEYREGMDALYEKYPFADTVLLSRRSGVERDAGLAYNVMKRIPPGQTSEIAKAVGLDSDIMQKFYDSKGQLDTWSKEDYNKFMSGIITISAVLEIPDDMTRREWTEAKNAYTKMNDDAKRQFGDDILDVVDGYYQAKTVSSENAENYLEKHPEAEDYLNWKSQRVMNSPLLSAYYGGASMIESYYRSEMYKDIETKLGKEIFDVMDAYNDLKTYGDPADTKKFYNQHKAQIKEYFKKKDEWAYIINQKVAQMSANLPDIQGAEIRPDVDTSSIGAQNLAETLQEQEQPTFEDFQRQIPERVLNMVQDYYMSGEPLTEATRKQMERLANELGYGSSDDLLQAIGTSMYAGQP